jgi:cobalamin biosynthesis protein CobT
MEGKLGHDETLHRELVERVRIHIRHLRSYLEQLGKKTVEDFAYRQGRRIDVAQARKAAIIGTPDLMIYSQEEVFPDLYLGVLIDRSGSMEGEKLKLAKSFGVLLVESARGLRGIEGHVNAFDDRTFFFLGDLQRNDVASITASGGNNDAGALARAAELAMRSRKRNKLIIMISDGSPTACSVESLKHLVEKLTREMGIVCAQAAVEEIAEVAFPHYINLGKYTMDEAVARFGKLIIQLTRHWR